ncbi:sporulation initiation factor Spo0A C-terminal domain-containing protein [Ruminococcus flavefaciens]|uniref:sporulation initiation factor Spo0A C-terminal domain-containing protein n=1 Tax=Ruminococcus flavefaciens TaxID=1265 RepID=UPI0003076975|nr:sporulation initiation factor Spo0A C-terminal domain-containing protein [Ruminococcus flavefaciens]
MLSTNTIINEKEEKEKYLFPADQSVKNTEMHTDQLERTVIRFIQKLGIRPNLIGYHLLIKAILMAIKSPNLLKSLTKELYPKIAKDYGKNVKAVERNMRKAIESAYEYDPQRIQSVFYYKVDKPYISEVLSMAVESIRYEL